ncbi:hypothetical protein CTA21_16305 [Salmonella enterica]|nr:hypothetical protein [Salmonella enterica]
MKPTDVNEMPAALETFARSSELAQTDAAEWLVFHSFLIDEESGRCGISPPMLAMTWDMAQTVFNSMLQESLAKMSEQYDQAWFARMVNTPQELHVGVFPKQGEGYPLEVMMLMDRRHMTMERYKEFYEKHATGETTVMEMRDPSHPRNLPEQNAPAKRTVH